MSSVTSADRLQLGELVTQGDVDRRVLAADEEHGRTVELVQERVRLGDAVDPEGDPRDALVALDVRRGADDEAAVLERRGGRTRQSRPRGRVVHVDRDRGVGDRHRADRRARERDERLGRAGCLGDRPVEPGQVELAGEARPRHRGRPGPVTASSTPKTTAWRSCMCRRRSWRFAVDLAHAAPLAGSSLGSTSTRACRTGRWCRAARTARCSPSSRYMTPRYWTTCANMSP